MTGTSSISAAPPGPVAAARHIALVPVLAMVAPECPTYSCTLAIAEHEYADDDGQTWHHDDRTGVTWPTNDAELEHLHSQQPTPDERSNN